MKILVVEDHPGCRDLMTFLLRNMGYEPVQVENGEEAIMCAITQQPDLILMDVSLPDINGVEVTAMLKRKVETARIPVVVISALPASIWGTKAVRAGASAYLTKPASAMQLRQTIERLTAESQELRR
jgi:CheY-like chemotaxis protein